MSWEAYWEWVKADAVVRLGIMAVIIMLFLIVKPFLDRPKG